MPTTTSSFQKLLSKLETKTLQLRLGGGQSNIDSHHKKNKLTAWERISYLLDDNKPFVEIGKFAGDNMYQDIGGCPNGGVVGVMAYVKDRLCIIVAHDATVKAGAHLPITVKKNASLSRNSNGKLSSNYLFSGFSGSIFTEAR
jgi:3-methylcrotonyl-CoA carboxylase beta subunit